MTAQFKDGRIVSLRNVAAHGYSTLKFNLLWNIIREDIPALKIEIEKLV